MWPSCWCCGGIGSPDPRGGVSTLGGTPGASTSTSARIAGGAKRHPGNVEAVPNSLGRKIRTLADAKRSPDSVHGAFPRPCGRPAWTGFAWMPPVPCPPTQRAVSSRRPRHNRGGWPARARLVSIANPWPASRATASRLSRCRMPSTGSANLGLIGAPLALRRTSGCPLSTRATRWRRMHHSINANEGNTLAPCSLTQRRARMKSEGLSAMTETPVETAGTAISEPLYPLGRSWQSRSCVREKGDSKSREWTENDSGCQEAAAKRSQYRDISDERYQRN